jgi:hypothetical protein
MIWAIAITVTVVAASGLALKYGVPWIRKETDWHISWHEFIAGLVAAYLVVIPGVFALGNFLAVKDALRYEEFYNGVETAANSWVMECHPGTSGNSEASGHSNCDHEYRTGETYTYTYYVSVTTCDSDNNCTTTLEARYATGYIYNPYATREYTYNILDSLGGEYNFPGGVFGSPTHFVKDGEGYGGNAIPAEIPRGDPPEWTEAWQRLNEGNPRPVTRLFDYENYILASEDDMLTPYSEDVERYLEEGILPDHTANILTDPLHGFNDSYADKVSFVGVDVPDETVWQDALMSFNAALGSELRGDLHLVMIDTSLVDSPTHYLNALKAHWLGDDFGRRAIAKNAIIVVAGVDGDMVEWGIASTGMPFGNEVMLRGIANFLPNTLLDPTQVIGVPRTVVTSGTDGDEVQVTLSESPGVLERVVLQDFPFKRACMDCTEEDGEIGYADLVVAIEPKPWQWTIMIIIVAVLSFVWWYVAGRFELFNRLPGFRERESDENNWYSSDDEYEQRSRISKRLRKWRRRLQYPD